MTASPGAVLITGASTGIGYDCALALDGLGYRVYAGVRRTDDAEALSQAASPRLQPVLLDVTQASDIARVRDQIQQAEGERGLSALINNAGYSLAGPLETVPPERLAHQMQVNALAPVALAQACLPLLRAAGGRMVMISSISGLMASPFVGPYAASKFALEAYSDALRQEVRAQGVRVIVIEPGAVCTPLWDKTGREAEALFLQAPPALRAWYESLFMKMGARAAASGAEGVPPAEVTRVILRALSAPNPRTRYLVGRHAGLYSAMRLLPDTRRDAMIAFALRR